MLPDVRPGPPRTRRDRAVAVGGFVCAAAGAAAVVWGDHGAYLLVDVVGGGLACVLLWWSRRWPASVALAVAALSVPAAAASVAAGIATLVAALYRRPAVAMAVGAAGVAATLARFWLRPPGVAPYAVWALVGVLFGCALTGWGMLARARRELMLSLLDRARRAEAEQELARQTERLAIAREMHDVLAHRLSLLALHAGALEFNAQADPGEVNEAARVVRSNAHQALQELRAVVSVLRETPDDLDALVEESRGAGMRIDLDGGGLRLPAATARAAYRIVQEGLTNARKHAPGRPVTVRLDGTAGQGVTVEVRNPLAGTRADGAGSGLTGLRERAALAGGRVERAEAFDGEFRLIVWLPWPL